MKITNFKQYDKAAMSTAIYPRDHALSYTALGLAGEAGEVANVVKKIVRDDFYTLTEHKRERLKDELGDVLWYLSRLSSECGWSLEEVAQANIEKLERRRALDTLHGSGDR